MRKTIHKMRRRIKLTPMKSQEKPEIKKPETTGAEETKTENEVLEKLEAAAKDLLFISETDAPLTAFFWPCESQKLTPNFVAAQAKMPADAKVETQTLNELFKESTTLEDWMNDDEKAEVQQFQELQKTLEDNLKNIQVFRFGETNIDVLVIGETEGGFAGLQTKVVET